MSGADGFDPYDHVTEREPGPWRDCTFAAMLEVLRDGFSDGVLIPPTEAEKEAFRAASGLPDDHAGATIGQAIDAAKKRYKLGRGWFVTRDWLDVRTALTMRGFRLVVQGSMAHVPATLRRHQASFTGTHAVAGRGGSVPMWCDPLAPKGVYAGEPVSIAVWQAYFTALPGAEAFITEIGALTRGGSMAIRYGLERWKFPKGTEFFDAPGGIQIGTFGTAKEVTTVGLGLDHSKDATPGLAGGWRAALVTSSALDDKLGLKIVYVKTEGGTRVTTSDEWDQFVAAALRDPQSFTWDDAPPPPADLTPYSQADLDAAVAKAEAKWRAWLTAAPK